MKQYKWKEPQNEYEQNEILYEVEDRDTRVLVISSQHINDPQWQIKPQACYSKDDLVEIKKHRDTK